MARWYRSTAARPPARWCLPLLASLAAAVLGPPLAAQVITTFPDPRYEVRVERSLPVEMRDGVRLSTDLYRPVGITAPVPVILIRTPYNKGPYRQRPGSAPFQFAGQGYVVAVQDKRGRFESQGTYIVSGGDAEDGYDTVEWLSHQPWSNGRVGTYGCSYLGDVQIFMATQRHPNLRAMIPQASGSSIGGAAGRYRMFGVLNGGAIELAAGLGWFRNNGSKVFYRPPDGVTRDEFLRFVDYFDPAPRVPELNFRAFWSTLPLVDLIERSGAPPTDWPDLVTRSPTDPWWRQFAYLTGDEQFDVPSLFVNSWYDFGVAETLLEFELFRAHSVSAEARDNQFVIISPTTHCASERATAQTVVGQREMGDARFPFPRVYLDWFDYWLRDADNAITQMPRVQYYVMGANEWRSASDWPVPGTRLTKYYLHSGGAANSRTGDGTLSTTAPGIEPPDRYVYDPANPVPSVGGPLCCTGTDDAPEGAYDQSSVEMRHDVLVYTTPRLERGVEVTGPLEVVLYVSSSARDTDFTAKLVDVYPDGTAYNVQEGILRARYRDGFDRTVWMQPNGVYELHVDLQATSNWFGPGHQIRVEISSSNFPRFDRNLNTGGNNYDETTWTVARNTVHHSAEHPSHIVLPVIP